MTKFSFMTGMIGLLLIYPGSSFAADAGETAGANQRGWTALLSYDLSHVSYRETTDDILLDKNHGFVHGGYLEARYDTEPLFVRGTLYFSPSGSLEYDGAVFIPPSTVVPYSSPQHQSFYEFELALGYKALNFGTATWAPYASFGYRSWARGEDNPPDYLEEYTWWYFAVGSNLAYRYQRWLAAIDIAFELPISPEVKASGAAAPTTSTLSLNSPFGFRAQLPVQYDLGAIHSTAVHVFLFGSVYYQLWLMEHSDTTAAGVYEPDSSTGVAGFRVGGGLSF